MPMDEKRLAEIEADIEKADNNVGMHCVFNLMTDTRELIAEIRALWEVKAALMEAARASDNLIDNITEEGCVIDADGNVISAAVNAIAAALAKTEGRS